MERKIKKTKSVAPKKAVKKAAKKAPKENFLEVVEIKKDIPLEENKNVELISEQSAVPVKESVKVEVLSTQNLSEEIVNATKKSETLWGKAVALFKDKIFITSLLAVSFLISIIFHVQKSNDRKDIKTEIIAKDSLIKPIVKIDTVFIDNPKTVQKIKDLEHELQFTRDNYNKAIEMLERR